ncbi:UNVERIFIED_CONTAM: putative WRKY transcription factor 70 [Sesamum calycinum]|uniref:WRKY transcription factor 70 n=1 Tax=Sesamum calycinum TaxID=2727403 RepID=A0AAW2NWI2_9LAMI
MGGSSSWVAAAAAPPPPPRIGGGSEWEKMIGELSRGREVADELRLMLRHTTAPLDATLVLPAAQSLVATILETFTHSLSILSPTPAAAAAHSDEVSQLPPLKSEDCAETPPTKDRRGCYKRRRSSETSTIETASLSEDGHAWRKYGQKVILNAKHPRSYFRCTHKFDQDCQATKQQRGLIHLGSGTTYHGRHTCKNLFNSSPHHHHHMMMMQDAAADDHDHSPIMWSFAAATHDDDHPKTTSLVMNDSSCSTAHINNTNAAGHHHELVVLKQENKELPEPQIKSSSSSSSSDATFVCPDHDPTKFDTMSSAPHHHHQLGAFSPAASSDVYSCTESTHSMEMDMMSMAVNFDDFLDLQTLN